jgi:ubiquinone/menaquinone biosynthesis C-methylase UbiE
MSYSQTVPKILDITQRKNKANQIIKIFEVKLNNCSKKSLLDVGCSSGVITNELAKIFRQVTGVDIDEEAINFAREKYRSANLKFESILDEKLPYKDNSFDVILFNQVYEFAPKPDLLISEIYRVLKPGGVCLVGARNKYAIIEGQTGVPFLHFFPEKLSKKISDNYYPANYMNLNELYKLLNKFTVENITIDILENPKKYGFTSLIKFASIFKSMPYFLKFNLLKYIPNYYFFCQKTIS